MLFRYLVRLEVGRKGVVGVEVAWVSPAARAARDHLDSDRGKEQAWLGWVEGQAGVVRKPWGAGIETGQDGAARNSGGRLGARLVAREEEEREGERGRLRSMFYIVAQCGREGERRRAAGHRPTMPSPCPVGHPLSRGGLGTGGPTWRGGEEPAGAAWAVGGLVRSHVVWRRAARGRRAAQEMANGGGVTARAETEQERDWRWKIGLICELPKVQGLYCKTKITFKP
jgi:hypothetical protein